MVVSSIGIYMCNGGCDGVLVVVVDCLSLLPDRRRSCGTRARRSCGKGGFARPALLGDGSRACLNLGWWWRSWWLCRGVEDCSLEQGLGGWWHEAHRDTVVIE